MGRDKWCRGRVEVEGARWEGRRVTRQVHDRVRGGRRRGAQRDPLFGGYVSWARRVLHDRGISRWGPGGDSDVAAGRGTFPRGRASSSSPRGRLRQD